MDPLIIEPSSEADAAFNSFLDEQIYEFNSQATGVHDGRRFAGIIKDASGNVIAAINGHTRGASCYVAHLWVHESQRGHGVGSALLRSAEQEAILRGCVQKRSSLPTPSKPPEFYERLGYVRAGHDTKLSVRPRAACVPQAVGDDVDKPTHLARRARPAHAKQPCPQCRREIPLVTLPPEHLKRYGWQPWQLWSTVDWCGQRVEGIPAPNTDGGWRLIEGEAS